jgi:hypothetical protein
MAALVASFSSAPRDTQSSYGRRARGRERAAVADRNEAFGFAAPLPCRRRVSRNMHARRATAPTVVLGLTSPYPVGTAQWVVDHIISV